MADTLVYSTEKTLAELGDKVPEDVKSTVNNALADLKAVKDNGSVDDIKAKAEALQQASYKLAEIVYQSDAAAAGAAAGDGAGAASGAYDTTPSDEPIEADYEVVDPTDEQA